MWIVVDCIATCCYGVFGLWYLYDDDMIPTQIGTYSGSDIIGLLFLRKDMWFW